MGSLDGGDWSAREAGKRQKAADVGELRQDLVTGKWAAVATGRAKRPDDFSSGKEAPKKRPELKNDCPFCRLDKYPQKPDVLRLPNDDSWQVHIFPNLYPVLESGEEFKSWNVGPHRAVESVGYHEILATRKHNQVDGLIMGVDLALQIEALVLRFRQLREESAVNYIQIIKNHGEEAGGSLEHPHHQIFSLPVIPSDIMDMLSGAEEYARNYKKNVYSVIIDFELKSGERIVSENDDFVAFCPFASRTAFEVWVVPKKNGPHFEDIGPDERLALAEIMKDIFSRLYIGLKDPPYNYNIYSSPCDETGFACSCPEYPNFCWHIEITPRLDMWGGFELGTGLEIVTALPEASADFLRSQKIEED